MKTQSRIIKFSIVIIFFVMIGFFSLGRVSADQYDPCPSGTGPGGITAGSYDPTTLTQDQRQWLFSTFGNAGQASVGYGGQDCGKTRPTNTPYVPPTEVPSTNPPVNSSTNTPEPIMSPTQRPCPSGTGPGGITAGSYDPTKLTQDQRQWLFSIFGNAGQASVGYGGQDCGSGGSSIRYCPSGTGPGGITAGSYDPTKLTQDQRQWLFTIFGNSGQASVGYGGQTCVGGIPYTPGSTTSGSTSGSTSKNCPPGTGPGGITAGSYDPTKLTQDQRNWLFQIFGHSGTASVGYGGETCSGGASYTPGSTTSGSTTKNCPSGTGPDGITAGSYDPTKLTQDQRNWLYQIFGHNGIASVGYGGETCSGGTSYTPGSTTGSSSTKNCPSGTGPDGITAGSYDPTKLTQDQRNWLYQIFGHNGTASVGYGGETCNGGTSYTSGTNNDSAGGSTTNEATINGSISQGVTTSGSNNSVNSPSIGSVLGESSQEQSNSGSQPTTSEKSPSALDWFWTSVDATGKAMDVVNNNLSNTFEAVSVVKDSYDLMNTSMTLEEAQKAYYDCNPTGSTGCLNLRREYSQAELSQFIVPIPFADIILKATGWWNPLIDSYEQAKYGN